MTSQPQSIPSATWLRHRARAAEGFPLTTVVLYRVALGLLWLAWAALAVATLPSQAAGLALVVSLPAVDYLRRVGETSIAEGLVTATLWVVMFLALGASGWLSHPAEMAVALVPLAALAYLLVPSAATAVVSRSNPSASGGHER